MLKNYSSGKNKNSLGAKGSIEKIQKILINHNAKSINFEFKEGKTVGIIFVLEIQGKDFGFKLPARVENVKKIFDQSGLRYKEDQPYNTAWANLRDWIDAQMALIDTEQTQIHEVFLPYMIDRTGVSVFERMEQNQFLLESPERRNQ